MRLFLNRFTETDKRARIIPGCKACKHPIDVHFGFPCNLLDGEHTEDRIPHVEEANKGPHPRIGYLYKYFSNLRVPSELKGAQIWNDMTMTERENCIQQIIEKTSGTN